MKALWADTAFLAGQGVMDYSLLVGVDSPNGALVVGIIDFLRQVSTSVYRQACRHEIVLSHSDMIAATIIKRADAEVQGSWCTACMTCSGHDICLVEGVHDAGTVNMA